MEDLRRGPVVGFKDRLRLQLHALDVVSKFEDLAAEEDEIVKMPTVVKDTWSKW